MCQKHKDVRIADRDAKHSRKQNRQFKNNKLDYSLDTTSTAESFLTILHYKDIASHHHSLFVRSHVTHPQAGSRRHFRWHRPFVDMTTPITRCGALAQSRSPRSGEVETASPERSDAGRSVKIGDGVAS